MKKLTLAFALMFFSASLTIAAGMPFEGTLKGANAFEKIQGNVEVTLQNKCTRDVKYTIKSGGTTTNGVVAKGDKVKVAAAVGAEICVDGDAFMIVAAGDAGQTFMVCR